MHDKYTIEGFMERYYGLENIDRFAYALGVSVDEALIILYRLYLKKIR